MKNKSETGFSYIDVMIAIVILLVGILALVSALAGAVFQSRGQQQQVDAKQIATSTIESIMAVKETDALVFGWKKVGNVGTNPDANGINQGIFVIGFQPVRTGAGPDEVIGTADDDGATITDFQRRIVISDVCDPDRPSSNCTPAPTKPFPVKVRTVEVTVTYLVGTFQRQEVVRTVLTDYAPVE